MTSSNVQFRVRIYNLVEDNCELFVSGDLVSLGEWDPARAMPLNREQRNIEEKWEMWSGHVEEEDAVELQYRYFVGTREMQIVSLEEIVRQRRLLHAEMIEKEQEEHEDKYGWVKGVDRMMVVSGWLTKCARVYVRVHGVKVHGAKEVLLQCEYAILSEERYIPVKSAAKINCYEYQEGAVLCGESDFVSFELYSENVAHTVVQLRVSQSEDVNDELGLAQVEFGGDMVVEPGLVREVPVYSSNVGQQIGTVQVDMLVVRPYEAWCRLLMDNCHKLDWPLYSFDNEPLHVGHRGSGATGHSRARENTVESMILALAHGVNMVEFDVHLTSDLVPVVYHDFKVAGVPMCELTAAHLHALGVEQNSHQGEGIGTMFPTLQHCLQMVPEQMTFNIELKYPQRLENGCNELETYFTRDQFADRILAELLKSFNHRIIVLSSFDADLCLTLALKQHVFPVMLLSQGRTDVYDNYADPRANEYTNSIWFAKTHELLGLCCFSSSLLHHHEPAPVLVHCITRKQRRLVLFVWGDLNNLPEMRTFWRQLGVHGIIFDRVCDLATAAISDSPIISYDNAKLCHPTVSVDCSRSYQSGLGRLHESGGGRSNIGGVVSRQMGVCYRPHSQPPYRALNLQLVSGRAVAVLGAASDGLSSSPAARPLHQLHQVKDLTNTAGHRQTPSHKFCTDISMDDSSIFQVHTIKEGRARYSAMLHVSIDSQRPFPGLDLRLPVSCIGAAPMRPITVHNRSIGSSRDDNMLNGIGSALSLDLRVVDPSTGIELHHLPEDDLVKLDVSLVDPKGNYREIQPLECSISFNKNIHSVAMSNSSKIIFSRCSIAINFQPEQRPMQWYPSPPGIHHHTTPFRLGPRLLHKNSSAPAAVFFQCLVLLCRHESLCLSHEFCSQPHRKSNRPASFSQGLRAADQDRFLLLYRTVRLDLQKIDPRSRNDGSNGDNNFIDSFNSHNDEVKRCRYSLCLTRVQAVMTSLLMTLLLLLVIVLVLILYRRHRAIYKLAYKTPPGPGSGLQRCQQQHTANNHNTSSVTRSSSLAGSPPQPHFYSKFNMASLSPPTLLSSSHHTGPPHSVLSYISDSQPSSSAAEHNPYCHKLYLLSTQDSATAQDQPDTNKLSSTTTTTNNNNLFFQLSEDSSEDVSPPARFSSLCPPRSTYQYDRSSAPLHLELGQYQRFSSYYDTLPKYQTVHPSTASTATFADQHHTIAATASNTGRIPVHTTTNNISSTQTATSTAPNLSGYSNIVCSLQSSIINERNNTNVML